MVEEVGEHVILVAGDDLSIKGGVEISHDKQGVSRIAHC